ncbi:MAG: hypothetical protein R3B52_00630 [Candidatus Paceibacterota bacterium]
MVFVLGLLALTIATFIWSTSRLVQQHRDVYDDVAQESDRLCAEQRAILVAAIQASAPSPEKVAGFARNVDTVHRRERQRSNSLAANFIRFYASNDPYSVSLGWSSKIFKEELKALQLYSESPRASILTNRYFEDESSETGWSLEFTEWHDGRLKAEMFSFQGEARVFPSLSAFEARFGSLEYLLARSVPE